MSTAFVSTSSTTLSPTWRLHFKPYVNGERVKWDEVTLHLVAGQKCTLMLDYEDSTFIGDPDGFLALVYEEGAEGQGLVFDPPLGQYCEMAEGTTSLSWTISSDKAPSGLFGLQFKFSVDSTLPPSPLLPGEIINIAQEVDVVFDEFPVTFETGAAYPCHGATHTFTVRPKPSSQLLNKNVKLGWGGESLGVVVTPSLGSAQLLGPDGVTWTLDCRNANTKGDFSLQLILMEGGGTSAPLQMSLGHNLVRAERWTTEHPGFWPEWVPYYISNIRAISVHLNSVAPGVPVFVNGTQRGSTDRQGVFSSKESQKLYNHYDKTLV